MTTNVPRILGGDSLAPITEPLLLAFLRQTGQAATFWTRYMTSIRTKGTGEYRHRTEDAVLAAHEMRLLPIARQTTHVGRTRTQGFCDGRDNAEDIIKTFGANRLQELGARFRMFLDVEGDHTSHLSKDYYLGWCDGLKHETGDIEIMPCVYGIPGDLRTWNAIRAALKEGATCYGTWLSHPYDIPKEPQQWNPNMLKPYTEIEGVPVIGWQYDFCGTFDVTVLNPELGDASDFLKTLVLPSKA